MKAECPQCKRPVPQVAVCPFCGGATGHGSPIEQVLAAADDGPAPAPSKTQAGQRPPDPKGKVQAQITRITQVKEGRPWLWPVVLVLVIGAVATTWWLRPRTVDVDVLAALASTAVDPCQGRPVCVLVFVAPDAPGAKSSRKTIDRMAAQFERGNIGFGIIVGADSPERIRAYAERYGEQANTWMDTGRWQAANQTTTVPTWYVLDSRRRAKTVVEGTYRPYDYHLEKLGL